MPGFLWIESEDSILSRVEELDGEASVSKACFRASYPVQLEGLIAKKPDSVYESGGRSGAWVKFKIAQSQEFVIGGYTPPEGSRKYFGSLIVGYYGPYGPMCSTS
jgi:ATP-dependent DNA ligase